MFLGNKDRKEERKNEKVPVFPKMSLNKYAELKSLHLFNLISLFLIPSLQSQHPRVLFNFLFLKSPLGF